MPVQVNLGPSCKYITQATLVYGINRWGLVTRCAHHQISVLELLAIVRDRKGEGEDAANSYFALDSHLTAVGLYNGLDDG